MTLVVGPFKRKIAVNSRSRIKIIKSLCVSLDLCVSVRVCVCVHTFRLEDLT